MKHENLDLREVEIDYSKDNYKDMFGLTDEEVGALSTKLHDVTKKARDKEITSGTQLCQALLSNLTPKEVLTVFGIGIAAQIERALSEASSSRLEELLKLLTKD